MFFLPCILDFSEIGGRKIIVVVVGKRGGTESVVLTIYQQPPKLNNFIIPYIFIHDQTVY